jgi:hypothetical protein
MPIEAEESTDKLVHRIFMVQIALIVFSCVLFRVGAYFDLGFFWFAFLAGIFGASLALQRRVQAGNAALVKALLPSWSTTLMPFLYGGMMAGVAYFLFVSTVLSGTDGGGLLAINLFPDFDYLTNEKINSNLKIQDWLYMRPKGMDDAGKLIIWCFLAGYSESFISGILKRLEQSTDEERETVS